MIFYASSRHALVRGWYTAPGRRPGEAEASHSSWEFIGPLPFAVKTVIPLPLINDSGAYAAEYLVKDIGL